MNSNQKLKKLLALKKERKQLEAKTWEETYLDSIESNSDEAEIEPEEKLSQFVDIAELHMSDILILYTDSPELLSGLDKRKIQNYLSRRRNRSGMGPYGWMV